jgi:hemolysin D
MPEVKLSPGMNTMAEIKTGQRWTIEFLLSPVQRAGSESMRKRLGKHRSGTVNITDH